MSALPVPPIHGAPSPETVYAAQQAGKAGICPECGEYVALGEFRRFIPHWRYNSACPGIGRYCAFPWPPALPGLETPEFLTRESVRAEFPPFVLPEPAK